MTYACIKNAAAPPRYLWIGCADARVPANQIMRESTGKVFVHRNVGNQVLSADMSVLATIQYAVDYLKVRTDLRRTLGVAPLCVVWSNNEGPKLPPLIVKKHAPPPNRPKFSPLS